LTDFVQSLSGKRSNNTCLKFFSEALQLDASPDQTVASFSRELVYGFPVPVPSNISTITDPSFSAEALLPRILNWYAGDRSDGEFIRVDTRVVLWVSGMRLER
jgi:hypothetical protein